MLDKPRWISVEEKLPDLGEFVLIVIDGEVHERTAYRRDWSNHGKREWIWQALNGISKKLVTHWMPLPEPPEGNWRNS